jgi:tripeptidyl-peptidase-1
VQVRFALRQQNVEKLLAFVDTVTDPASPKFGQFLSNEEVRELVSPPAEQVKRVTDWLAREAPEAHVDTTRGDVVVVDTTVAGASSLLSTDFAHFHHVESGKMLTRAMRVSIPDELDDIVELVHNVMELPEGAKQQTSIPAVPSKEKRQNSNNNDAGYVIPEVLRKALYAIPDADYRDVSAKSSVAVVEFQGVPSYSPQDNKMFDSQTGEVDTKVTKVVGPPPGASGGEEALDIQYMAALALNSSLWYWTETNWLLEFAQDFNAEADAPYAVSISWGWYSTGQCDINCNGMTAEQYINRAEVEFAKGVARGTSFFASSGDQGAPGDNNAYCEGTTISDIYPGTSHYFTSVGATMFSGDVSGDAEAAVSDYPNAPICHAGTYTCASAPQTEVACSYPQSLITTGGGTSAYLTMPAWQQSAVNGYLASGVTLPSSSSGYFPKNRWFPDVSANGHGYLIALDGQMEQVDGTSCSSPVWAGIAALLNGRRFSQGKGPIGFLNKVLYSAPAAVFTDITEGNNNCTESCCGTGFQATTGWDPVTGLGTPNFPALASYIDSLP